MNRRCALDGGRQSIAETQNDILDETAGDQDLAEAFCRQKIGKIGQRLVREMTRIGGVAPFARPEAVEQ